MTRFFSNGPSKDFVVTPYQSLVHSSSEILAAAPYVTRTQELVRAAKAGKSVSLLVGLNVSTSPEALKALVNEANSEIRYFTSRFHAKFNIFDEEALLGSANLTNGGLEENREATIRIDDVEELDELRGLFDELWETAHVLTPDILHQFAVKREMVKAAAQNADALIEATVGKVQPKNISLGSRRSSPKGKFLQGLERDVQQYRAAFVEVDRLLEENHLRRSDLEDIGPSMETNRFLNWLRLTHILGDDAWESAPLRGERERRDQVIQFGQEWIKTEKTKVPPDYIEGFRFVKRICGSRDAIMDATQDQLIEAFLSVHAFLEQSRFTAGGRASIPALFWGANNNDVKRIQESIAFLLFGAGDFLHRLHDFLYDPARRLRFFGRFCALELYGSIKPKEFPPINGRMAKSLRFLGYNVKGR